MQRPAGQPALRAGLGRPADRRDPGLLRRLERAGHRLRPGAAPARFVVQAVRAGRRAAGRQGPAGPRRRARLHLRRRVRAARSSDVTVNNSEGFDCVGVRRQDGHDQVDQHRLLPDGPGRRPGPGDRRRAPGRHPGRPAARAARRHRARRPGGAPDRHGLGLRHVRRRRGAPPAVHRGQGDHGRRPGADRPHRRRPPAAPRRCPQQVARNVTESMLGVAGSSEHRAGRRAHRRGEDRHRAAARDPGPEQGRLDGRLHAVDLHRGLGRQRRQRLDPGRQRQADLRADGARARSGRST